MTNPTRIQRKSERELVVTRLFDAPAHIVFKAWTTAELFQRWWAPKSMGMPIRACEMDVRTGGGYRLEFGADASQSFTFFGKYVEVIPGARLVWTNEENDDGSVTTVTFEEQPGGKTLLTLHELFPTEQALDDLGGQDEALPEQFEQLDELLVTLV